MNEEQKDICISLIGAAKTRNEVFNAMKDIFKRLDDKELRKFISGNWELYPKLHIISLRKMDYAGKYREMVKLLSLQHDGACKSIHLYISNTICMHKGKHIQKEMYNDLVGEQLPTRDSLRGTKVKLIGMSDNRICIRVHGLTFTEHNFTIWDIDCRRTIEVQY